MNKASIICESCGQDNEIGATFCIECGSSLSVSKLGQLPPIEEPISTRSTSRSRQSIRETDISRRPRKSRSRCMGPMHMMNMDFNPKFLMMPIMFIIIIYILFFR